MGNSEVGHLNIGAGRVVWQDVVRIDQTIKNGEFSKTPVVKKTLEAAKNGNGRLHLCGLVSHGGVVRVYSTRAHQGTSPGFQAANNAFSISTLSRSTCTLSSRPPRSTRFPRSTSTSSAMAVTPTPSLAPAICRSCWTPSRSSVSASWPLSSAVTTPWTVTRGGRESSSPSRVWSLVRVRRAVTLSPLLRNDMRRARTTSS